MKVAVSIPDDLFERTERLRPLEERSRSSVCTAAPADYVARPAPHEVTDALSRVCAEANPEPDEFVRAAGSRILERSEW